MGKGYLKANLSVGENLLPIANAELLVTDARGNILHRAVTDRYGKVEPIELEAPDIRELAAKYDVVIPDHDGYKKVIYHGVEIFDGETTILPVKMHPKIMGYSEQMNTDEYFITEARAAQGCSRCGPDPGNSALPSRLVANEVAIPDYITVHLGSPNNDSAQNYRLPFKDYIKNVASREIFPCWTESALIANILAQISFTLNRVYTLHYRSRFKPFDITNQTAWDQAFDPSKTTFESISNIVDRIFASFLRRQGRREPFFASYCSGTTATCDGLYQCESQELGMAGYSPMEILRNYYPNDIQLVESFNLSEGQGFFPGTPLREGSTGDDVLRMQVFLNRLSGNWWIDPIPPQSVNGVFGAATKRAVTMFQQNTPLGLTPDGIIGRNTWYEITRLYIAATQLAELTSEGQRIGIGASPPTVTLYANTTPPTKGAYVVELQFLLNYISQFYETIAPVIQNGVFKEDTKRSVIYFQQEFGLTPDGVVGPATWKALYDVFRSLQNEVEVPPAPPTPEPPPSPTVPQFPGTPLRVGSRGSDVVLMQTSLNAISSVYPAIPALSPDGIFGPLTETAVKAFQRTFGLTQDGVIGSKTWYKIFDIYNSLTMDSEPEFPGTNLTIGSRGDDVLLMQDYLRAISRIFPSVPAPAADGIFGTGTAASVRAFQTLFGLTADGVIGKQTWDKIVYVFNSMPDVEAPTFPGTLLRVGSRGNNVTLMQKYLNFISTSHPSVPALSADGIFGPITERSVLAFQRLFGLAEDGIIGRITWSKIVTAYNMAMMNAPAATAAFEREAVEVMEYFGASKPRGACGCAAEEDLSRTSRAMYRVSEGEACRKNRRHGTDRCQRDGQCRAEDRCRADNCRRECARNQPCQTNREAQRRGMDDRRLMEDRCRSGSQCQGGSRCHTVDGNRADNCRREGAQHRPCRCRRDNRQY